VSDRFTKNYYRFLSEFSYTGSIQYYRSSGSTVRYGMVVPVLPVAVLRTGTPSSPLTTGMCAVRYADCCGRLFEETVAVDIFRIDSNTLGGITMILFGKPRIGIGTAATNTKKHRPLSTASRRDGNAPGTLYSTLTMNPSRFSYGDVDHS
jgi:hypothetical protein